MSVVRIAELYDEFKTLDPRDGTYARRKSEIIAEAQPLARVEESKVSVDEKN